MIKRVCPSECKAVVPRLMSGLGEVASDEDYNKNKKQGSIREAEGVIRKLMGHGPLAPPGPWQQRGQRRTMQAKASWQLVELGPREAA